MKPDISEDIEKAKALRNKNDLSAAENILNKLTVSCPENEWVHVELGHIYNTREYWQEAAREYGKALEINPGNKIAIKEMSKMLVLQKKYGLAEELCNKILASEPHNSQIHVRLSKIYRLNGKYKASLSTLKKALKYDRDNMAVKNFISQVDQVKGFRKTIPPFRVFFTWGMTNNCNYNCSYCYVPDGDEDRLPDFDTVISSWAKIQDKYGRCRIRMDGGEPSVFPKFTTLVDELSRMHNLQINTNLSFDIDEFLKNTDPRQVRVDASYHPEYANLDEFVEKTVKLMEEGFKVVVSMVAYPPFIDSLKKYGRVFGERDIEFIIHPFSGLYNGKDYPKSYSPREKRIVYNIDTDSKTQMQWREEHGPGVARKESKGKVVSADSEDNDKMYEIKAKGKEKLCRMGQMYGRIYPGGDTYACCTNNGFIKLGNLYKGGINLLDEALSCSHEECRCWRCMRAGEEETWLGTWLDDWEMPL